MGARHLPGGRLADLPRLRAGAGGWLVSSSFQTEREIVSKPPHWIPHEPTLQNFAAIFFAGDKAVTYANRRKGDPATGGFIPSTARNLLPAMRNSLIVALSVAFLNLLVGVPAAYAMAKIRFRGRHASIYGILTTRVIPDIALVVPFFLFIRNLGLLDSIWSLIITYLAITVPFSVFILVTYFESLPDELDKAARVDGCSRWQTMSRVFLPLALPSLVAVVLFAFLSSWNEFLLALDVHADAEVADAADHRRLVHLRLHRQLFLHQRRRRAGDHSAGDPGDHVRALHRVRAHGRRGQGLRERDAPWHASSSRT